MTAIDRGDVAVESHGEIPRVPWEEVAVAGAEQWSFAEIENALGNEAATTLPELVRLTDLHVRVPRFGVLLLAQIAQQDGTTIYTIVARQLLDLAVASSDVLEQSIAGIDAAIRWPVA